jgi:hypothetical protein
MSYNVAMCVALVVAVCASALAVAAYQRLKRDPFHERVFHGPLAVSYRWEEIKPEPALRPERDKQVLVLGLAEPFVSGLGDRGVRLPDGTLAVPEVELVAKDGTVYPLKFAGSFGRYKPFYEKEERFPKDAEFTTVRVRCDNRIELKLLAWTTYNMKDLH